MKKLCKTKFTYEKCPNFINLGMVSFYDKNRQFLICAESAGLEPASPCEHLVSTEASYQLELTLQKQDTMSKQGSNL